MTALNFTIWSLQVALITAAGSFLPKLFRLESPKLRLAYSQVLLLVCLALPLVQPYREGQPQGRAVISATTGPVTIRSGTDGVFPAWSLEEMALGIWIAGVTVRLLLLATGFVRLRRLRRSGMPVQSLAESLPKTMQRVAAHTEFYVSEAITGPVTFGFRRPVVLLPAGFPELAPERREPILCHELLHVQRKDWLYAVAEELIRSVLWFHPAIWWLLGQIQLTREQAVDQAVIEHTRAKDEYVNALLAMAAARMEADLAPAPLFLRKQHLRQRIASIYLGVSMPKRRLILSTFAVFSALPLVVGITAWQFPLSATPQEVNDSPGIEVRSGANQILHRPGIAYPAGALEKHISGEVILTANVNAKGEVIDARVVSGPEDLRGPAMQSVLRWHFVPMAERTTTSPVEVAIRFSADKISAPGATSNPGMGTAYPLESLDLNRLPASIRERIARANLVQPGELLSPDRVQQLQDGLRGIDDHLRLTASVRNNRLVLQANLSDAAESAQPPNRIKVGGNVQAANIINKVVPVYPRDAKEARVQGIVRLQVVIDKQGYVTDVDLISGDALLVQAAIDAVKQWVYRPTLLNGQPIEVITTVDINFTLLD